MKTIKVNLKDQGYELHIDHNIRLRVGEILKGLYENKTICIITDENVMDLYGNELKESLEGSNLIFHFMVVKPGEESKSIETLKQVLDQLAEWYIKRSDLIVAFGGGVIGDLAGFAASIYLRGVDYIQIPTTLLSQVDSSIGGKTAVNLESGKNLVGSFYQPKLVLMDPSFLHTLSHDSIRDGMGEVIKYACIKDADLFDQLSEIGSKEELLDCIETIIYTCCNIKRAVVEVDQKDTGERMVLNFGHTLAHAIEKYFDYQYSHGQAVGVGMYYITEKSEGLGYTKKGTTEKIKKVLVNFNMDYKIEGIDSESVRHLLKRDKKNLDKALNLVLLREIGDCFIEKVGEEDIKLFF